MGMFSLDEQPEFIIKDAALNKIQKILKDNMLTNVGKIIQIQQTLNYVQKELKKETL